jgi:sec-independent protein translocase protein TatC
MSNPKLPPSSADPTLPVPSAPTDPAAITPSAVPEEADPDPPAVDGDLEDKRMSLLEHLSELRVRLRNAGIAFIVAMIGSFALVKKFFAVLVEPTVQGISAATGNRVRFIATSPTEGFWVYMKLSMIAGIVVAAPLVFWELWKFVAPGLYKKEKKIALMVTGATAGCFMGGAVFGYFVLSRPAAYFLTQMTIDFATGQDFDVNADWKIETLSDYLMLTLGGCGAAFELPVVLVLLGALGFITAKGLWKFNRYALVLSAVAGAVLTPSTDPFTMLLLTGPLYALYNVSILFVWMIERGRKKKNDSLDGGDGDSDSGVDPKPA